MIYEFTRFNAKLIPDMEALQAAYKSIYPRAFLPPAAGYLAPWAAGGENVICALDETGKLRGYAPFAASPTPTTEPDRPYTFWAEVKVDPGMGTPEELKDILLEKVVNRVSEITQTLPPCKRQLAFQYHPSELSTIDYIRSKGAVYAGSGLRKRRDLSLEIPALPALTGIEIRYSQMKDEREQREYVHVRNHAFVVGRGEAVPPLAISLTDWQRTLKDTILPKGTVVLACDAGQIIGSVYLCWNEEENQRIGRKVGTIENVFVRDGWRRQGIASRMICEGFEYLKENGLEFARLDMNSANEPALKLYESLGFVTVYEGIQMFMLALPKVDVAEGRTT